VEETRPVERLVRVKLGLRLMVPVRDVRYDLKGKVLE